MNQSSALGFGSPPLMIISEFGGSTLCLGLLGVGNCDFAGVGNEEQ